MRLKVVFMVRLVSNTLDRALRLGRTIHSLRLATGSSNNTHSSRSSRSNHNTDNQIATTNTLPLNSKAINRLLAAHRSNTDSTTHTAHHLISNTQNYPEILTVSSSSHSSTANNSSSQVVTDRDSSLTRLRRLWARTRIRDSTRIKGSIRTRDSILTKDSICIRDKGRDKASSIRLTILMPLHSSRVRCMGKGMAGGMVSSRRVRAGSQ